MEGLLAILAGAFAVAVSPLVPVMRPAAKAAVKGGLALAGVATGAAAGAAAVATGAAAAANQQWEQLRSHTSAEKTPAPGAEMAETVDSEAMAVEPAGGSVSDKAAPAVATTIAAESDAGSAAAASTATATGVAVEGDETAPGARLSNDEVVAAGENVPSAETESASELLAIDGIGPKAAGILAAAGITTFAELAATDVGKLRALLAAAGPRYRSVNPSSWPEQASRQLEAE